MYRELYSPPHPEIARLLSNVAISYSKLGQENKALEFKEESLKMYCELRSSKLISDNDSFDDESMQDKKALEFKDNSGKMNREFVSHINPSFPRILSNCCIIL
jgi:hypothetical protein